MITPLRVRSCAAMKRERFSSPAGSDAPRTMICHRAHRRPPPTMSKRQNRNAWRRRAPWLAAVACFFHFEQAWAQTVLLQLRNGDRLSGTILSEDAGKLTLKTTWWNVVVIPVAEIKSRENLPAPAPAPTAPATNPPVALAGAAPPATPPIKPPTPKQWTGEAQARTALAFKQRSRQLYN